MERIQIKARAQVLVALAFAIFALGQTGFAAAPSSMFRCEQLFLSPSREAEAKRMWFVNPWLMSSPWGKTSVPELTPRQREVSALIGTITRETRAIQARARRYGKIASLREGLTAEATQLYDKARRLRDLLGAELEERGFSVETDWGASENVSLRIRKGPENSPMGRVIEALKENYNTVLRIEVSPAAVSNGAAGGFQYFMARGLIILDYRFAFTRADRMNQILLHEIRHAKYRNDLVRGIDSPFHGEFYGVMETTAEGDEILQPTLPFNTYNRYFSLEELSNFMRQLKQAERGMDYAPDVGWEMDNWTPQALRQMVREASGDVMVLLDSIKSLDAAEFETLEVGWNHVKGRSVNVVKASVPVYRNGQQIGVFSAFLVRAKKNDSQKKLVGHLRNFIEKARAEAQAINEESQSI